MTLSTTKTIARLPHLTTFLADSPTAVAGWGRKPSGRRAVWLARLLRRPVALLEDGFVRSVDRNAPTLSLLVDDIGVYYDAARPSRMERVISDGADGDQAARAARLTAQWRAGRVSKYNHSPEYPDRLPDRYVLVIDQTFGDLSVVGGLASPERFSAMLSAALAENPDAEVIVKVHPDVFSKAKRGYFDPSSSRARIRIIGTDCHPVRLLERATAVYCVTSLMGFEALLWGRPVRCFGMPFYAGWGITQDELPRPMRRHDARLEDVVHAALVALARYADPVNGARWKAEQAIDHVARERSALLSRRFGDAAL